MAQLPASIRVALWVSHAWAHERDLDAALAQALPDVDIVLGLPEQLGLWRGLGENAVYASLPRPGASGLLPQCDEEAFDAATFVGEAVFAAGVGAVSIPRHVTFGAQDPGLALRWEAYDAAPVPVHRLAGVDVTAADRDLRAAVHTATDALGDGGWADAWQRERPGRVEREWGLPPDLPDRVRALVVRAGVILEIAEAGLAHADGSTSAELAEHRRAPLLVLRAVAETALEAAACGGVAYLAAQSRTMRS
ncbi:MAG: hypothetical protein LC679_02205 [Intrasporangiaceae bacterium]|nr:hypothetical protein [Intrasporangiaceae bacterium]